MICYLRKWKKWLFIVTTTQRKDKIFNCIIPKNIWWTEFNFFNVKQPLEIVNVKQPLVIHVRISLFNLIVLWQSHQIYKKTVKSGLLFKKVVDRSSLYTVKYCTWNFNHVPEVTALTKISLNTEIYYLWNM